MAINPGPDAETSEVVAPAAAGDVFPADRGGVLLAERLAPSEQAGGRAPALASDPVPFVEPREFEVPEALLSGVDFRPPVAEVDKTAQASLPRPPADDPPLVREFSETHPDPEVRLAVGPPVRTPEPDVETPVALPILARPAADYARPDPAWEMSLVGALSGSSPWRLLPVVEIAVNVQRNPKTHLGAIPRSPRTEEPVP